jgi:hypothetical protein
VIGGDAWRLFWEQWPFLSLLPVSWRAHSLVDFPVALHASLLGSTLFRIIGALFIAAGLTVLLNLSHVSRFQALDPKSGFRRCYSFGEL